MLLTSGMIFGKPAITSCASTSQSLKRDACQSGTSAKLYWETSLNYVVNYFEATGWKGYGSRGFYL